ncbi:SSBP2 protein, partial [Pygoscelis papua]
QTLGGVPGSQPLLPSGMDPTRQQGHPNMGGPMQRMTPPRGMVPLGPQVPSMDIYIFLLTGSVLILYYSGFLGPGGGRPWPNPTSANSVKISARPPGNQYCFKAIGCGGVSTMGEVTILPTISAQIRADWIPKEYLPPFPMGPGSDGPMSGLGGMDSHHMNGSLG